MSKNQRDNIVKKLNAQWENISNWFSTTIKTLYNVYTSSEKLIKDNKTEDEIWQSEIFGRSLDTIVQEGIQAKLSLLPDSAKYKLSQTITKMVNKGSNNLIAIVL